MTTPAPTWQARYLMLPVVWLGQYVVSKRYEYSVPANDNCFPANQKRG